MTRREMRRRREAAKRKRAVRVALAALAVMGLVVAIAACTTFGEDDEPEMELPQPVVESQTPVATPEPTPTPEPSPSIEPEDTEPEEPTVEEMLEDGTLTDSIALSYDLQLVARDAARTFGVPYKLLLAVMFRESSYNPDAENGICFGLMQIHQMNFEWLEEELADYGVTDIRNNPEDNIKAGAYLLGRYIAKYDNYHLALVCYNCGEGGAQSLWAEGIYSTQYSRSVLETMEELDGVVRENGEAW